MKFLYIISLVVVALFATTQACDPKCRVAVSDTFAVHYNVEIRKLFELLRKALIKVLAPPHPALPDNPEHRKGQHFGASSNTPAQSAVNKEIPQLTKQF